MTSQIQQSAEEKIQIVDYWEKNLASPNLIRSDYNLGLIMEDINRHSFGYVSVTTITEAVSRLGDSSQGGKLQFGGTRTIEKIVEVPVDMRTPQQIHDDHLRQKDAKPWLGERSDGNIRTEFDAIEEKQRAGKKFYNSTAELLDLAVKEKEEARINAETARIISNVGGQTHARRERNKAALQAELTRLLVAKTEPAEINKCIRALEQSFS